MSNLLNETMLILGDLVGFPTVTSDSNLPLIDHAIQRLEAVGADLRVTRDATRQKANLFATVGPPVDGGIILSGHTDVVPAHEAGWTGSPFVAMRREQRIYGRGTADMKGFVACALASAPHVAALPLRRPLHIALTYDEEVGCRGAPALIADLLDFGVRPAAAIVGEPTEMSIVVAHKGMHEYTTTISGVEGHGSQPALAVNAVQYGARYVAQLMSLANELANGAPVSSPYDPPHTTVSVGSMHGGTAHNVVPGECVIRWEMRPVTADDTRLVIDQMARFESAMVAEMRSVSPGAGISTITEGAVDGLNDDRDSPAFRLASELVGSSERTVAAFSTEAGLYQAAGIPAVVCGPGSIDVAHQPDEYVGLDQLEMCLRMMSRLGERLTTA